jgi:hypothetical protein
MGNRKIKLGIYQHYKGGMVEVIAIANHSETLEEMIVYKTLYENRSFGKGSLWVRPSSMFLENVEVDGKSIPRFRFIGQKV